MSDRTCRYCEGEPDAGWIETPNNGPIVTCPVCNPSTAQDDAFDRAEAQRDWQRRGGNHE